MRTAIFFGILLTIMFCGCALPDNGLSSPAVTSSPPITSIEDFINRICDYRAVVTVSQLDAFLEPVPNRAVTFDQVGKWVFGDYYVSSLEGIAQSYAVGTSPAENTWGASIWGNGDPESGFNVTGVYNPTVRFIFFNSTKNQFHVYEYLSYGAPHDDKNVWFGDAHIFYLNPVNNGQIAAGAPSLEIFPNVRTGDILELRITGTDYYHYKGIWAGDYGANRGSSLYEVTAVLGTPLDTITVNAMADIQWSAYNTLFQFNGSSGAYIHYVDPIAAVNIRIFFSRLNDGQFYVNSLYMQDFSQNPDFTPVNVQQVANPYPPIDNGGVEYVNNAIISPVLPYRDFFSLFTKLPLGHTKASGNDINIGVIGDGSMADFIYFIARDAHVYTLGDLTVLTIAELVNRNISVVAISDFRNIGRASLELFVQDCRRNNISVVIEGDLASTDTEIQTVNRLEQRGAISVGRVDRQGTTYYTSGTTTMAFNPRLREIGITVFTAPMFTSTNPPGNYRYALFGVTAALALKLESGALDPAALKSFVQTHSRPAWQMRSIDGLTNYTVSADPVTSQYTPTGPEIYSFTLLDFQYLLEVRTAAAWNANIYNLSKAWSYGTGNVDVAVIDQGFHPDAPAIKNNIVEKVKFGNTDWNGNFHGTSMCKALLSIAPSARLHILLADTFSSEVSRKPDNIILALDYCIQQNIKIVSMSWSSIFNTDVNLINKIRQAKDAGIVVVWFHYAQQEAGIIRPGFTYGSGSYVSGRPVAIDRFIEPDMFYPQEIQAGLSYTSPQIAGLAALIMEKYPAFTPAEVEAMLLDHSVVLPNGALVPDMLQILQ